MRYNKINFSLRNSYTIHVKLIVLHVYIKKIKIRLIKINLIKTHEINEKWMAILGRNKNFFISSAASHKPREKMISSMMITAFGGRRKKFN